MTNPDPASAVASAAIAAAAAGPLSKLVFGNQRQVQQSILVEITKTKTTRLSFPLDATSAGWRMSNRVDKFHNQLLAENDILL